MLSKLYGMIVCLDICLFSEELDTYMDKLSYMYVRLFTCLQDISVSL